jgi:O-antigen/teichoic acid export membrane protein
MVAPINRVLFPTYVQLADDLNRLRAAFQSTLGLIASLILPASVGLAAVADPLVRVLLGEKWLETIPVISLLALAGASTVLQTNTGSLHNALGQPRMILLTGIIQVGLLLPMLLLATFRFGIEGTAAAVLVHAIVIGLPTTYAVVFRTTPVRVGDVVSACWRPVLASAVMYGAVRSFLAFVETRPELMHAIGALLGACVLGLVVYVATVAALWLLVGRPRGAESSLIARIKPVWIRLRTRER